MATTTDTATEDDTQETKQAQEHPYYCPACGRKYDYRQRCKGTDEQPHKACEVVSTDELNGDPSKHTPAPPTTGI